MYIHTEVHSTLSMYIASSSTSAATLRQRCWISKMKILFLGELWLIVCLLCLQLLSNIANTSFPVESHGNIIPSKWHFWLILFMRRNRWIGIILFIHSFWTTPDSSILQRLMRAVGVLAWENPHPNPQWGNQTDGKTDWIQWNHKSISPFLLYFKWKLLISST